MKAPFVPTVLVALGLGFALVPLSQGRFFFYWDNAQQHYAQTLFLQDGLARGVIPQWWPAVGLGFPVTAEGQAAHYHPVRLLASVLFSAHAALMWELAIYFAIAGLATYGFLRELRLHRFACLIGAVSQMFTGFAIVYVRNLALHRSFCLLPLAMLFAERYVRRRSRRDLAFAALVSGVQFLAGHPSLAIVTSIATTTYVTFRLAQLAADRRSWRRQSPRAFIAHVAAAAGWAGSVLLGIAIAAVQMIPTLLHIQQSQRQGGLSFEAAVEAVTATPRGLLQLVFPYAYTQGDFLPEPAVWGNFNPVPTAGMYCGLVCVVFAPAALWWRRRWPDATLPLAASFVTAIGFALGPHAPLFPLLWSLPGMNGLRFPSRFLLWAAFCLSCLAALGAQRLMAVSRLGIGRNQKLTPLLIVATGLAALAGVVFWQLPDRAPGVAVSLGGYAVALVLAFLLATTSRRLQAGLLLVTAALAVGDLMAFRRAGNYAPAVPFEEAVAPSTAVEALKRDAEPSRVMSLTTSELGAFLTRDLKDYVQADLCTIWGLDSADVFLSLFLKRNYAVRLSIVHELLARPESARRLSSFMGALNVKYLAAPNGIGLSGWQKAAELERTTLWRNPDSLPRAFLVGRVVPQRFDLRDDWRQRADQRLEVYRREALDWSTRNVDAQILDHVMSAGIDYRRTAEVLDSEAADAGDVSDRETVTELPGGPDEMRFSVRTSRPRFLVVSSSFYPGWSAAVNGQPARVVQTNWVLSGLAVPEGESTVVLRYTTPGFRIGAATSLLALAITALLLIWPLTKRATHARA